MGARGLARWREGRGPSTVEELVPSELEVAAGLVVGGTNTPPVRTTGPKVSYRDALRRAVLPALQRAPCLVSFSGGRDSSAVLAVATAVARQEQLPDPVPFTLRFARDPRAEESDWQEMVVRHLGLREWSVHDPGDDLDWVGPYARRALARHGLLWPQNTHFLLPALDAARGGALLTGNGGDQVLEPFLWQHVHAVLRLQARPHRRDPLRMALAFGPAPLRRARVGGRATLELPWLRPCAQRAFDDLRMRSAAEEPVSKGRALTHHWATSRSRLFHRAGLARLAADADVLLVHPLDEDGSLAALAKHRDLPGWSDRTQAMRALFADLLPPAVVARESKAAMAKVFWARDSMALAEEWDGTPIVDADLVDTEQLRQTWAAERVDWRSAWMLQALWLRTMQSDADSEGG